MAPAKPRQQVPAEMWHEQAYRLVVTELSFTNSCMFGIIRNSSLELRDSTCIENVNTNTPFLPSDIQNKRVQRKLLDMISMKV